MPRYICIHGHFYQPPRENPWLETIELQESAAPWHDWNSRISAECYSRNAASRILNEDGDIKKICNNYSRMSFNIGPTLLAWLEENDTLCYKAILEADLIGRKKFSGHGPAIAQVYNHIIMPLANRRDKETQVKWGIADFKKRFGRMPEGMWLAECAVDTETLEVLAENGILFTVLSPWQAQSVRSIGWGDWQDVSGAKIDTRHAYRCNLPSGRSIALFFYDGVLSQKIAFAGLLNDGGNFARQLIDAYEDRGQPILSHVATDGESYGHHHKHGDMALAYCLDVLDRSSEAQLTVYGEFLAYYPPESEVKIIENSSWSCAHGVERWRSDCGCSAGTPGFHQKWRKPLRDSLNYLRDRLAELFVSRRGAGGIFSDPWNARDRYINVILDRSNENVIQWLNNNAKYELSKRERVRALALLEIERNSLLMFTSCGWFFDEISRIEPVQIMRYAARAIELAKLLFDVDLEPPFLKMLSEAPSNIPALQNGAKIYELLAKQGRVDRVQMAAYYGISTLVKDFKRNFSEGCWDMSGNALKLGVSETDSKEFSAGVVKVRSRITGAEGEYLFAVNHRGGMSMLCGVSELQSGNHNNPFTLEEVKELRSIFDDEEKKGMMVEKFGYNLYTIRHIPADARHKMIDELLRQDVEKLEKSVRDIVINYDQLLEYLTMMGATPPAVISIAAKFTLTSDITRKLREKHPDVMSITRDFELASFWQVKPEEEQIRFAFSDGINNIMNKLLENGPDLKIIHDANELIKLFTENFEWHLSLYDAQNLYNEFLRKYISEVKKESLEIRRALYLLGRSLHFSEEILTFKH